MASAHDAQAFLNQLDARRKKDGHQSRWAEPHINPFDGRAAIPWNREQLNSYTGLANGIDILKEHELTEQGWSTGHFRGYFAKARTKLEEAQLIRSALDAFDKKPNFPAYRALFFGYLSAIYAVKEALREACGRLKGNPKKWWEKKYREIERDELLKLFYDMNNADKHNLGSTQLRPRALIKGVRGDAAGKQITCSGEGAFFVSNQGTARARRVFLEIEGSFKPYLDLDGLVHKGDDVSSLDLKQLIDFSLRHYEELVFEARQSFEPAVKDRT